MVTRCIQDGSRVYLQRERNEYKQQADVTMVGEQFLAFGQGRPISDVFLSPAALAIVGRPLFAEVVLDPLQYKAMDLLQKRVFPPVLSHRVTHMSDWLEIGLARCKPRKQPRPTPGEEGITFAPPPHPGGEVIGGAYCLLRDIM